MIYDFPEPSSPIGQGDIFFGVPILDLPADQLPIIGDDDTPRILSWEEFSSAGESVNAVIAVRPTIAIVGTQECDAVRAPDITLFEVRPFRDVERKSKDTTKPAKLVSIITQHARVNQKWFYLPADERIGFAHKMAADFLTPIGIPRLALERLINFRRGRLNEVAKQHFRERLAEFFRRYAYEEWYSLTREELAEYQKTHPNAEPFPWQRKDNASEVIEEASKGADLEVNDNDVEEHQYVGGLDAGNEVVAILRWINTETDHLVDKFQRHVTQIEAEPSAYAKIAREGASDMDKFSQAVEVVLPNFEGNIATLDASYSAYVAAANPASRTDTEQISTFRHSLSVTLDIARQAKEGTVEFRNTILAIGELKISEELQIASSRQSRALDSIISNLEKFESIASRVILRIDAKFGEL